MRLLSSVTTLEVHEKENGARQTVTNTKRIKQE